MLTNKVKLAQAEEKLKSNIRAIIIDGNSRDGFLMKRWHIGVQRCVLALMFEAWK